MSKNYKYSILREEVEGIDYFEESTHEKISESLTKLINDENKGITIGLSGQWGSGKSTIINLLKKKKDFVFFYFDAWAHEGDPLRRIFLESLIICLREEEISEELKSRLEEIRKTISKEERVKITLVERSTTKLGLYLAVATLMLTIGVALVSAIDYNNLTFEYTGDINFAFLIGLIFSLSPFFVLTHNYCKLKSSMQDVNDLRNWSFLQNNSTETITESISNDEERTSIEFERYFKEIIQLFNIENSKKFVIVLDNLDRIDANDSLKIWSTLQTFIQHKNPISRDYDTFKKIFTIIPYDEESLEKIWENHKVDGNGERTIDKEFSKSFFDKSFQVRIDVPRPILSNWLGFIKKLIEENFNDWEEEDKDVMIEVIQVTRENILDNPKPREIKNYLNQIGFLRNHFDEKISTKSISYYVFKRYLENKSNQEIANELAPNIVSNKNLTLENNFLTNENIVELAAITYGVSLKKGEEILLTPKILAGLSESSGEQLKNCESEFKGVFWALLVNIISRTSDFNSILKYSSSLFKAFGEVKINRIRDSYIKTFILYLSKETNANNRIDSSYNENIKNSAYFLYLYNKKLEIEILWKYYNDVLFFNVNQVSTSRESNEKLFRMVLKTLKEIQEYTQIEFKQIKLDFDLDKWAVLCVQSREINFYGYLIPNQEIIDETGSYITQGNKIESHIYDMANYYLYSNVEDLNIILDQLLNHFKWNMGRQASSVFDTKSFDLFYNYFMSYKSYNYSLFFDSYEVYRVFYENKSHENNHINKFSIICGINFDKNVSKIMLDNSGSPFVNEMLAEIRAFWSSIDVNHANEVIIVFKEYNCLDLIWEIAKDYQNKLIGVIVSQLIINKEFDVFKIENVLEKISLLTDLGIEEDKIKDIIEAFIDHSKLEEELLKITPHDLVSSGYVLSQVVKMLKGKRSLNAIEKQTKLLTKEDFLKSFLDENYLRELAIELKNKNVHFTLNHSYYEAYNEFVTGSLLKNTNTHDISEWERLNWDKLFSLMDDAHIEQTINKNSNLVLDEKDNLKTDFFILNKDYIDTNLVISKIKDNLGDFKIYIEEAFKAPYDIDKMFFIGFIFKIDSTKEIAFRSFKEVISEPVNNFLKEDLTIEIKELIIDIAKRLGVKVI